MTEREIWVLGVATLRTLLKDDLVLARALKARDYKTLYASAMIARRGLKESMALTDPGLYSTLNKAIVLMHLKGYGALDVDRLRTLALGG